MTNTIRNYKGTISELNCFKNWLIKNKHKPNEYIVFSLNDENKIVPYGLTEKGINMWGRYSEVGN